MKKQIALILSLIALCFTASAQTNSVLGIFWNGAKNAYQGTNWSVYGIGGHSLTKNYWLVGAGISYNITPQVAPVIGVDERLNSKTHTFSDINGGLNLELPIQPLTSLGITNFWVTPYAGLLAATGSGGNALGSIVEAGADLDLYNFRAWAVHLGGDYQNCSGQGVFSANYAAGHLAVGRALPEGIPLAYHQESAHEAFRHALNHWTYGGEY